MIERAIARSMAAIATALLLSTCALVEMAEVPTEPATGGRPTVLPPAEPPPPTRRTALAELPGPPASLPTPAVRGTDLPVPDADFSPTGVQGLRQFWLELINRDRTQAGLQPVGLGDVATRAAQAHAEEMVRYLYMSHWNLEGHGPPYRYSRAGGLNAVQENVYMYWQRYDDGRPVPIENWEGVIRDAQASLMNSPGHRANILAPEHNYVGLGIAYNAATGDVRLDQLFTNYYVHLDPVSTEAVLGQEIALRGFLEPAVHTPLLNLAYEPFPKPMTRDQLNETATYSSAAEIYDAAGLSVDPQGRFEHTIKLNYQGRSGLYYVRIWVQGPFGEILANEIVIAVR